MKNETSQPIKIAIALFFGTLLSVYALKIISLLEEIKSLL